MIHVMPSGLTRTANLTLVPDQLRAVRDFFVMADATEP